ncbi:site-specific recombinase XerD [Mucilaginibacter yixingensis]|uniref:Site-specific recombinase XerD n=1 Tax=Mucilaginibacter yixingensis TaxID=1295612 RepID=A0A2T5J4H6_9SPHI|nr:tyrosine-type recombinase/integrase [Mucilaginibacter yixingensis]PTQ92402.1 site-specific recombinase XerD [Mucilaginibacter yixingensis]
MYTIPCICFPEDPAGRIYIYYHYNGIRHREYNGKGLGLAIHPNRYRDHESRERLAVALQTAFHQALLAGWQPKGTPPKGHSLRSALQLVLEEKQTSELSDVYKKNLKALHQHFTDFLLPHELASPYDYLLPGRVEAFLSKYHTKERSYTNYRRCLSVFFKAIVRKGYGTKDLIAHTRPGRPKAVRNIPFTDEQLKGILKYLEPHYPQLYLYCLLTYGSLLRPHKEIRLLQKQHIVKDCTEIVLSGKENKSGKVRIVYLPEYVQQKIRPRFQAISKPGGNLFTVATKPYNTSYFNLQWRRASIQLKKDGLLQPGQTIYSFRHTAAIRIYQKCKDPYVLQQLLQHSSLKVTLDYLRGLGELRQEHLRAFLPEL